VFEDALAPFFADFAESVTVQGVGAAGIFDVSAELVLGDVVGTAPVLQLPASVAAAAGGTCVIRGQTYVIRQVLDQPPDGRVRQLVLARG
jgi:hypothetical protein